MTREGVVSTPFSWSFSRQRSFDACRRRYGLEYYAARQGWRRPPGHPAREAYVLKRAVTPGQWAGQLAHEAVEGLLRDRIGGGRPDPAARVADVLRRARAAIVDARAGLWRTDPRAAVSFDVLHYGSDPGDAYWTQVVDEVGAATEGLLAHPLVRRLTEVPHRIVEVERHTRLVLDGVRAVVALDVLVADGRGGLVVIDWKTGRSHDPELVDRQLATYVLAVTRRRGVPPGRVAGVHADARSGTHRTVRFDAAALDRTRHDVVAAGEAMAALLPDPRRDVLDGFALPPHAEGHPDCAVCRFRRLCGR